MYFLKTGHAGRFVLLMRWVSPDGQAALQKALGRKWGKLVCYVQEHPLGAYYRATALVLILGKRVFYLMKRPLR